MTRCRSWAGGPPRSGPGRWLTASARRGQRLVALHAIPRRHAEKRGGLAPWGLRRSDACGRGTGAGATRAGNRGPGRTEDAPPGRCTDSSAPPLGTSSQSCNFFGLCKVRITRQMFNFWVILRRKCLIYSFGKDEVPSSNLGSSSTKKRLNREI